MIGSLIARTAAGLNAFVAGRRFGQEWAQGHWFESEVRRVLDREPPATLALSAVALGTTAVMALRKKEIALLALAGWFVGSGGLDRVMERAGLNVRRERVVVARHPSSTATTVVL